MFVCADCTALEGVVIVPVQDDAHEEAGSGVDYCPACGDYLSLVNMGEVQVEGRGALYHLRERVFGGGRVE